jgi:hypothetical protein
MGLSVLVPREVKTLMATASWGDYEYAGPGHEDGPAEAPETGEAAGPPAGGAPADRRRKWRRLPRTIPLPIELPAPGGKPVKFDLPESGGMALVITVRAVAPRLAQSGLIPEGTRSVSVFLVNSRPPQDSAYRAFAFQAGLRLDSKVPFVPRPDLRGAFGETDTDWDEAVADLHYRDVFEYAVGHGVAATHRMDPDGECRAVMTTCVPEAEVERVAPKDIPGVELGMEALGKLTSSAEATAKLSPLVARYRTWIAEQKQTASGLSARRKETANDLLLQAEVVAKRIEAGIALLATPDVLESFRVANQAMARAARQREWITKGRNAAEPPEKLAPPAWRPFQLAYLLMTMRGIAEPKHADREVVDLLFFPTGGGKTEAYLGLAAFTMVLRRLRNPGIHSAGVSVLMRYTLRLLTLDQLSRAAALICALEIEREEMKDTTGEKRLGDWPFEIALWVGQAATPNRMGGRGEPDSGGHTAYTKTMQYKRGTRKAAPIPLENCPWCGEKFTKEAFRLIPNDIKPKDLRVTCVNYKCLFSGDHPLPMVTVDEPIYRRLPAFMIATVDKFAALPWTGETGALFGLVNRFDDGGFYGPCKSGGTPLGGPLPPPDLVIQDELHLISGPLGTIAGVYETAIDALATREVDGKPVRPKVIASTATVRRADTQIRALFERSQVTIFPALGPDRKDSFFSHTLPSTESPARLYVGVAAQGKSLKVVLLRSALALLSAGQAAWERAGGKANKQNPADAYMTLLGYFNSLRELGGSRRIIEDEVSTRLRQYSRRRRIEPEDRLFADRGIQYEVVELTSRVQTNEVANAKRRLALTFHEEERVDVALATNMISVGLDIIRLGLMVVLGQPKTSAEYIQATSRVGRVPERPGLVVTLLNIHKPRDRSHYERFGMYHATFYRAVEATSVTPFSPRALDRALAGSLVALCRHGKMEMTSALGAGGVLLHRPALAAFAERMAERARNHDPELPPEEAEKLHGKVLARCNALLDDWLNIAKDFKSKNTALQYQKEEGAAQRLLYEPLSPELKDIGKVRRQFRANRSMRDVEPVVEVNVKNSGT